MRPGTARFPKASDLVRTLALDRPEVDQVTLESWATHLGEPVVDPMELRTWLARGSLPEVFADTAHRESASSAITVRGRVVSHGDLDALAGRAAACLDRVGVEAGSRVLVVADVGIEEIATYLGVLRLGATAVLANPTLTIEEMGVLVTNSESGWVVGSGRGLERASAIHHQGLLEVVGLREPDRGVASVMLGDVTPAALSPRSVDPESAAVLAFTSGTTGRPKPTPLSHRNLLASVRGVMAAWRWHRDDHLVHSLPISHQHGLSGVHATLLAGSRATLLGSFDGEETLDTVVRGAGTVHFGVPAIYQRLLDRLGSRVTGLSALRLAVSGSDSLPVDIALRYSEQVGQDLLERYGTTESGLNVSNPYLGARMPGLVGLPLPGVEVALADKSGNPVGEGEAGEILIRGPHVFSGYLGIAESSQPFVQGWFGTGDLGISDPETRYLRIVGRTKEVIITGGMNVYPREVEEVLRRHPRVTDAAVIGVASARWGEEVVAVVSPVDLDPDAVLGFAAERLAPYKRPKRVFPVEVIPRSDVGKLRRAAVDRIIPLAGAEVPPDGIGSPLP